jgi:hypothetical protein
MAAAHFMGTVFTPAAASTVASRDSMAAADITVGDGTVADGVADTAMPGAVTAPDG